MKDGVGNTVQPLSNRTSLEIGNRNIHNVHSMISL